MNGDQAGFMVMLRRKGKPYRRRSDFVRAVYRWLVSKGYVPVAGLRDEAGNCRICGEAGRCPGWHTSCELWP